MRLRLTILAQLLLMACFSASAQDDQALTEIIPAFKDRALVINIAAGIVEQNQEVVWNTTASKTTISGRPVSIKLMGQNIMVVALFTPYHRRGKTMLVAQGQVWINIPNEGMRYETTMQTMPLEYGEKVYFFPLGKDSETENSHIVIQIELTPYQNSGEAVPPGEEGHVRGGRRRPPGTTVSETPEPPPPSGE